MNRTFTLLGAATACGIALTAGPAMAYIGPGAGLSLLGALWGVLAAVFAVLAFLLLWPLRRMMRRRKAAAAERREARDEEVTQVPGAAQHRR